MQDIEKFVAWIKTKGGQRALAAAISKKTPKDPLSQTAISNWVTRRFVPVERRALLETMGWDGPWEWPGEAPTVAGGYVTREEYGALDARLKAAEKSLEETRNALIGATGAIRLLATKSGSPEILALLK